MEYLKRSIEPAIEAALQDSKIAILYGPRQVGKTTLARHIANSIDPNYKYINCDEPDVRLALSGKSSTQLRQYLGNNTMVVIDEAQRVDNIGISLKLLADTYPDVRIIATGSSSFELANSINEPLTGRAYYFTVWPLSIAELSGGDPVIATRLLDSLLITGSYPVVSLQLASDTTRYLSDLTTNYLYKDLLGHGVIRSESTLIKLLQLLALQLGGEVNLSELARTLTIDVATVKRLIDLLEKAFVIHRLKPLFNNKRIGIRKSQKIYFTDLGIRNTLIGNLNPLDLRTDAGALWENFCVNELRKRQSIKSSPVNNYFWRSYGGSEVDYIEDKGGQLYPYEFKWGTKQPKLPKEFTDTFTSQPLTILSPHTIISLLN